MANTQELQNLLERVEKATGPDRELDARLSVTLGVIKMTTDNNGIAFFKIPVRKGDWAFLSGCKGGEDDAYRALGECLTVRRYTASIDDALELVERVLPGAAYVLNAFRVATKPDDVWMFKCHLSDGCSGIADGRTQALAILAAMLLALIAQDDEVVA